MYYLDNILSFPVCIAFSFLHHFIEKQNSGLLLFQNHIHFFKEKDMLILYKANPKPAYLIYCVFMWKIPLL